MPALFPNAAEQPAAQRNTVWGGPHRFIDEQWQRKFNLVTNPSFETDLNGWSLYNNALSPAPALARVDLTTSKAGRWAARLTNSTDTTGDMGVNTPGSAQPAVTAGETYTLSVYGSPAGSGGTFRCHIHWIDGTGAIIGGGVTGATQIGVGNSWVRASATGVAPAGAVKASLYAWVNNPASGFVFYFDGFMFEKASVASDYFDGDTFGYEWTGTPHASSSQTVAEHPSGGAIGDVVPRVASDFFKIGNPLTVRTPARILFSTDLTRAAPTTVSDVISLTPGVNLYNAQTGWSDLGVTKGGIRIARTMSDDGYTIEHASGIVRMTRAVGDVMVEGAIADMTLARMATIWQNPVETLAGGDQRLGGGLSIDEALRRLVVCHPLPGGKIRMYVFPLVEVASAENSLAFNKSGEQQSLNFRFRALADPAQIRLDLRHFYVLERTG